MNFLLSLLSAEQARWLGAHRDDATDLQTGKDVLLLEPNTNELSVTSNGISLAYNSADGHFRMNRYLLRLSLNADARTGGRIDCYSGGPSAAIIGSHS